MRPETPPKTEDISPSISLRETSTVEPDKDEHLTLWQALRKWRRVSLYCVGLTSAILMYGFDYVIVGSSSAMPSFQQDYGQKYGDGWILPSLWFGIWNFASPGASMIGSVVGGLLQDWLGRRTSLAVGSFLSAIGVAIIYVSNVSDDINVRRSVFLAGKAFQGGAIGIVMVTAQTYMSEILPTKLRGSVLAFFPTFTLLGQLIGAAVIKACSTVDQGYKICFAVQWPFSAIPFFVAMIIPESPTYLIRKGQYDRALKAQKRLDPPGVDTQRSIDLIKRNIEHESQQSEATYVDCFKGTNLRRTLIIVFANLMPQIFGLMLLSKASYFMQVVGMDADLSLVVLVAGIGCGLIANLVSIWILSLYGRRILTLLSLAILTVLWTSMGIAGIWSGQATIWYCTAVMILVIVVGGLGIWPCSYVIGAETSSLHLRAKAQGIGWFTAGASSAIFGFTLPFAFNVDQGNLSAKTGFIYTGLCSIALVVTFYYVPEMKGRTPAEIDRMFELEIPARKFETWNRQDELSSNHSAGYSQG